MKNILVILSAIIIVTGCANKNTYKVELTNQKISICGEEKFITDYTYNNEFDIESLINDIRNCNEKLVNDKDFYKQNYIDLAEDYNNRLQELGIDEYILTDTSR